MIVLVTTNHKGGAGKTATAVHLASVLAETEKRVLLIDNDLQGDASKHLGYFPKHTTQRPGLPKLLQDDPHTVEEVAQPSRFDDHPSLSDTLNFRAYLDVVLNGPAYEDEALRLFGMVDLEDRFRRHAREIGRTYAYCIIDTDPGIGSRALKGALALAGALVQLGAHGGAVIPFFPSGTDVQGLIRMIQRLRQLEVPVTAAVPTRFEKAKSLHGQLVGDLKEALEGLGLGSLITRPVRNCIRMNEANQYGLTVFEHGPNGISASDYRDAAMDVVSNITSAIPSDGSAVQPTS